MSLILYEKPLINSSDNKPPAIAGKPYLYDQLADSRRFEELVYSLYKAEIEGDGFGNFDDISLMSGVREKGRDCALLRDGKNHGLIQCKKYGRAYSKDDFGEEITRFAMYALVEKTLIHDADDFTYYIAVINGFVLSCNDLIDDFNRNIVSEKGLDKWITAGLKQPSLRLLGLRDVKREVLEILSRIRVKRIQDIDLDRLMAKAGNTQMASLFFELRTVTDNSLVEKLLNRKLSAEDIKRELKRASVTISAQKNEFAGIPGSHIVRKETRQLFDWVMAPGRRDSQDREENICLLAANAGMGKTVIIKDLYDQLDAEGIPVLALKADQSYAGSIRGLQERIGISEPLYDFIERCKQLFPKLVILIDQLDALSQSMSADRSFLNSYTQLTNNYKYDPAVRIIISVRLFDLYYDPALNIYHHIKSFEVSKLDEKVVLDLLAELGLGKHSITDGLLELLRTPNHLDIFSRVFKTGGNFAGIRTLVDLYDELWKVKVLHPAGTSPIGPASLVELLYEVADEIYSRQVITVSETKFEKFTRELSYLRTERLVNAGQHGLQFFHQSFYDYVFARRFVQAGTTLKAFLEKEEQSIMARSAFKMIVNHLRAFDPGQYIAQVRETLTDKRYYFHIRHLLISFLAGLETPLPEETALVEAIVLPDPLYREVFLEQVMGKTWLDLLFDQGLPEQLLFPAAGKRGLFQSREKHQQEEVAAKNRKLAILFNLLIKNLPYDRDRVIGFLFKVPDDNFVFRILFNLKEWNNPKAFELLDRFDENMNVSSWGYFSLLQGVADFAPGYVFEKLKRNLFEQNSGRPRQEDDRESRLLKVLFGKIPEELCLYAIGVLETEIPKKTFDYADSRLLNDYFVGGIDLKEKETSLRGEGFYKLFARQMRVFGRQQAPFFLDFLKEQLRSPYRSMIRLVIFTLQGNEAIYPGEIFDLLLYLQSQEVFDNHGRLNYELRVLLGGAYKHFSAEQQSAVKQMILNLKVPKEGRRYWGLTKLFFLNVLSPEVVSGDRELKRAFQELIRLHGPEKERAPQGAVLSGAVRAPLSDSAYARMSQAGWIRSFRKYDRFYDRRANGRFLSGGLSHHAEAFLKASSANPAKHLAILTEVAGDESIEMEYAIKGIEGLIIARFELAQCLALFKVLLKRGVEECNVIACLNLADKLMDNTRYDSEVLDFVIAQALQGQLPQDREKTSYHSEPKGSFDAFAQYGMGTHRGMAARMLVHISDGRFQDQVFTALEQVFASGPVVVKAAAIYEYAFLMNLNAARAFELFLEVVKNPGNRNIRSCTLWSLGYLVNYDFKRLLPHLRELVSSPGLLPDDRSWLATILFGAYVQGYPQAEKLFNRFLTMHPEAKGHALDDALQYFYQDGLVSGKAFQLAQRLLSEKKTVQTKDLDLHFHYLEELKFADVCPLLQQYVGSDFFSMKESFLEYLTENTVTYPLECIGLFERAMSRKDLPADDEDNFYGNEGLATRFIIGAYNSLRPVQHKAHRRYQRKLLSAFDKVLLDARFRVNAEQVLEKVIS
jgi:hypothetical protein